jgi:hypothetical protein
MAQAKVAHATTAQSWLSKRNNVTERKILSVAVKKRQTSKKLRIPPACIFKSRTKIEQKCK